MLNKNVNRKLKDKLVVAVVTTHCPDRILVYITLPQYDPSHCFITSSAAFITMDTCP